jgi:hypothetical protein
MDWSFTISAGPCQHSHSQARVPLDSWSHFAVSDSRLPQPGGSGPHIYIPQEQGGLLIHRHWVPFSSTHRALVEVFDHASTQVLPPKPTYFPVNSFIRKALGLWEQWNCDSSGIVARIWGGNPNYLLAITRVRREKAETVSCCCYDTGQKLKVPLPLPYLFPVCLYYAQEKCIILLLHAWVLVQDSLFYHYFLCQKSTEIMTAVCSKWFLWNNS